MIRPVLQLLVEDTACLAGIAFVNASKHSACRPFYPHLLPSPPRPFPAATLLPSFCKATCMYLTAQAA